MSPIALCALLLALASPEDQIRSRYLAWDEAYLNHDVVRLSTLLDPTFVLVTGRGTSVSRKDYVARLWKSGLPEVQETRVLKLSFDRNRAKAWTVERSKKPGSPVAEHRYEDTWLLRDGRWRMTQSKTVGGH